MTNMKRARHTAEHLSSTENVQVSDVPCVIYGLYERTTPTLVWYVGQTVNPDGRLGFYRSKSARCSQTLQAWLEQTARDGKHWEMRVLEHCSSSVSAERERYWIETCRARNPKLLNCTVPISGTDRTRAGMIRAKREGTRSGRAIGRPRAGLEARCRELRAAGLSLKRIGMTLGCSPAYVCKSVKGRYERP